MNSSFDRFIKFLMHRPLLVNLILIFIVLASIISMYRMQRVALPRIDLYNVSIYTVYPGAAPEDVELNVTRKIEESIKGISDIEKYTSLSIENMSIVNMDIRRDTEDKDEVINDIRDAINNITDFPDEITEKPTIYEEKADEWPMLYIGIYTENESSDEYIRIAKDLKDEILPLSTVAEVSIAGSTDPEVRILLDKEKLKEYKLSIEEIISAIQANKIRLSAGSLESYTSETNIVTLAEFEKAEDVGDIIIRINDAGNDIMLKDISRIVSTYEEQNTLNRINGHKGTTLTITKQGNADIIRAVAQVNKTITAFRNNHLIADSIKIIPVRDESVETQQRLNILISNAAVGLLLVLILLFLFFNRQLAIWTAMGIPIAVGIAFIAVGCLNITINRVSLLGLVVVLGMLVDDSIIVGENIYRYRTRGHAPEEAALLGVKTVMVPVFATVITTVIAFLPMYFIPGMALDFAREIPSFVIAMLVGSLIESVLILPVHLGHEKKKKGKKKKSAQKPPLGEGLLRFLENGYATVLGFMLKHKWLSFGSIVLGFAIMLGLSTVMVKFKMFPVDQASHMYFWGETKQESTLLYTSGIVRPIEEILDSLPEGTVESYRTTIGQTGQYSSQTLPNLFRIELSLYPSTQRKMTAMDIKEYVYTEIENHSIAGLDKFDYYIDGGGPPAGKAVEINIIGNDNDTRTELLDRIAGELKELGLTEVDSNYRPGKPELRLSPNKRVMAQAGLSISQIASVIRTAFDGTTVTYMDTAEEQVPFRLQLDKNIINKDDPLDGLYTINNMGIVIPVDNLLNRKKSNTPQTIYRFNGKRTNKLTANLPEGMTANDIYSTLQEKYKNFEKEYPGFKIELGGEAEEENETMTKMFFAIALAVIAVYFVLVIQFNSIIQPIMVISAIPFGLIGILMAFGIQRMDLSMLALVGIMGYAGVVVNDSLIMVDYINTVRREHGDTDKETFAQNILQGARLRLRPIFLTTITTVAGLIPTAYGLFGGLDSFISPMVMTMAWGLIVGTPSVLFIIPLYYSIIEDFREFFANIRYTLFGEN